MPSWPSWAQSTRTWPSSTSGCRPRTRRKGSSPLARSWPIGLGRRRLVLSQYIEPGYALTLLEERPNGVGYLLKERISDAAVLMDTLHRLAEGESVIDPTIVKALMERSRRPTRLDELTDRELDVLALVAEGLSNRAIAQRLFIAERTVEAHIARILPKLGATEGPDVHRRALAALAFVEGTRQE